MLESIGTSSRRAGQLAFEVIKIRGHVVGDDSTVASYFFERPDFTFCLRSCASLVRPRACLFAIKSSSEMKFTGTAKKVLQSLLFQAWRNATPGNSAGMSRRLGGAPHL